MIARTHRTVLLSAVLVLLSATGAPADTRRNQQEYMLGPDDRVLVVPDSYPLSAIGRVIIRDGGLELCTGALVGADLVLTAAHCLIGQHGERAQMVEFQAGEVDGEPEVKSGVIDWHVPRDYGTRSDDPADDTHVGNDWAVLVLEQPLGKRYGWFGTMDIADLGRRFPLRGFNEAGYSTGRLAADLDCTVVSILPEAGILYHECNSAPGDSGAPIWVRQGDGYYVVGVDSTGRFGMTPQGPRAKINIAAAGGFIEAVRRLAQRR